MSRKEASYSDRIIWPKWLNMTEWIWPKMVKNYLIWTPNLTYDFRSYSSGHVESVKWFSLAEKRVFAIFNSVVRIWITNMAIIQYILTASRPKIAPSSCVFCLVGFFRVLLLDYSIILKARPDDHLIMN